MEKFASLVVLSYHRAQALAYTLHSLHQNTRPRYELIVVEDGSRDSCWPIAYQALLSRQVSTVIFNAGMNLGVGEGIHRGWSIAKGAYLAKLDADLEYSEGWLERGEQILDERPDIGMVGWFDYLHYEPNRNVQFEVYREEELSDGFKIKIVKDFVGSAFMIRRDTYEKFGPIDVGSEAFAEDVMFKNKLTAAGLQLAITGTDMINNFGFGLGKSTVVEADENGEAHVARIAKQPLLFGVG